MPAVGIQVYFSTRWSCSLWTNGSVKELGVGLGALQSIKKVNTFAVFLTNMSHILKMQVPQGMD